MLKFFCEKSRKSGNFVEYYICYGVGDEMAGFSQEFLGTLSDKADIVDIISDYVTLKSSGRGSYVGLCPFHREKTPSFSVSADKQLFYCFGCHASGNVFGFIMKAENLSFVDAVRFLANRVNLPLPEESGSGNWLSKDEKQRLYDANRAAARYYHETLYTPDGQEALAYLRSRGLDDRIIRRFGLGYAPNSSRDLAELLHQKGFTNTELMDAGLCKMGDSGARDFFRNRVMFPILDLSGEVIAFGGRVMDKTEPKYLNTGDTPIFNKRKHLYGLPFIKKNRSRKAILCEGYMDVIALNMNGYDYAVASLGTALTRDQIKLLNRYSPEMYICYDGDKAGVAATHKAIELTRAEKIKPRVIALAGGKDPDEYMRELGAGAFADAMQASKWAIDYLLQEAAEQNPLTDDESKARYAFLASQIVGKNAFDSIETELYLRRISQQTGFSLESLYRNIGKAPNEISMSIASAQPVYQSGAVQRAPRDSQLYTERMMIRLMTENPRLCDIAQEQGLPELLQVQENKSLCEMLIAAKQGGRPLAMQELNLQCAQDAKLSEAVAAIFMDDTAYIDAAQYFADGIKKLRLLELQRQRTLAQGTLTQYSRQEIYLSAEEVQALLKRITELDAKMQRLKRAD